MLVITPGALDNSLWGDVTSMVGLLVQIRNEISAEGEDAGPGSSAPAACPVSSQTRWFRTEAVKIGKLTQQIGAQISAVPKCTDLFPV